MTSCPRCGEVKVVLDHTKDGHPYLRNYGPPHRFTCTVNKKARPKASPLVRETKEMIAEAWGRGRVRELLPYAKGSDLQARYLAVLAHEVAALKAKEA